MSFTYDLGTNRGKLRLLIKDIDSTSYIFEDAEIDGFLALNSNDLYSAASDALYSMASSQSLLAKKIKAGDYTEDAKDVAKNLIALANKYQQRSENTPADAQAQEIFDQFSNECVVKTESLSNE